MLATVLRSPTAMLLAFCAGVALQLHSAALPTASWLVFAYGACLGACASAVAVRLACKRRLCSSGALRWSGLCCALALGGLGWSVATTIALRVAQQRLSLALEHRTLWAQGTIQTMVQERNGGLRFEFSVEHWQSKPPPSVAIAPKRLRVFWPQVSAHQVWPGQRWRLPLSLRAIHGQANPAGFDYELYEWEQGITATAVVQSQGQDRPTLVSDQAWLAPIERLRQRWRSAIYQTLGADTPSAPLIAALTLGDQAALAPEDWRAFRRSGIAHLVSISGLHITLFAWLAVRLLRRIGQLWTRVQPLGLERLPWPLLSMAQWGGLLLATAYALLSGWGLPAQRTVLMLACFTLQHSLALRWPWWQVGALALTLIASFDPWALMQPGFWLSFVAVAILFASTSPRGYGASAPATTASAHSSAIPPSLTPAIAAPPARVNALPAPHRLQARLTTQLLALLREQGIMTLTLAPLTLLFFQQVSLIGLLANLLAIPWVTLLLIPLALLGLLCSPLWHAAAWAAQGLTWTMHYLASWPLAVWEMPAVPWPVAACALAGCVLAVLPLPLVIRLWGLGWWLPLLLWRPLPPPVGEWRVHALDVGQGSALIVQTAQHTLLYDSGPAWNGGDAGERTVLPALRALGLNPDTLMLSHNDSDHSGGALSIFARYPNIAFIGSEVLTHPAPASTPALDLPVLRRCQAGQTWTWDSVRFTVVHPSLKEHACAEAVHGNACSCVLHISSASGYSLLLTGDIAAAQEADILQRYPQLRSDVLLLPHHGSKHSSSASFLSHLKAHGLSLAFAQAGYVNRYGHPHPETQARLAALGIPFLSSPVCGAWRWESRTGQGAVNAEQFRNGCYRVSQRRYWHSAPSRK